MTISLTRDQQHAYIAVAQLLAHPTQQALLIEGYAGTGKTTLIRHLLENMSALQKTASLISPGQQPERKVVLTATTAKACEALARNIAQEVRTIHSVLGLRVKKDYATNQTRLLAPNHSAEARVLSGALVFIDEASYVNADLATHIFNLLPHCKLVFLGDPAQLTAVGCNSAPLFCAGLPTVTLTEVVRQAEGNQIQDLSTAFRDMVSSGEFVSCQPNGTDVIHLETDPFEEMILAEYRRADWQPDYSRVLAWTNKRVLGYNQAIREQVQGTSRFHPGDYAICNHYLRAGGYTIKTDQQVRITNMSPTRDGETNVPGWQVTLNDRCSAFLPEIPEHRQQGEKLARKAKNWALLKHIDENWIDLRDPYACTVNKAQGATYDRVFIDLDDIKQCRSNNQLARMLYVAVSRAREQVVFTGDLV